MQTIHIPGKGNEQLFLEDLETTMPDGTWLRVDAHVPDEPLVTRHLARYHLLASLCRSGHTVLDFPCGSGYGATLVPDSVSYEGRDASAVCIAYATSLYGHRGTYLVDDLCHPNLPPRAYDVIGCIEGLEHISSEDQQRLIPALATAIQPDGLVLVSSPESTRGVSSPNPLNPYHRYELIREDFESLLAASFRWVEVITQIDRLHTGEVHRCFYAICREPIQ